MPTEPVVIIPDLTFTMDPNRYYEVKIPTIPSPAVGADLEQAYLEAKKNLADANRQIRNAKKFQASVATGMIELHQRYPYIDQEPKK